MAKKDCLSWLSKRVALIRWPPNKVSLHIMVLLQQLLKTSKYTYLVSSTTSTSGGVIGVLEWPAVGSSPPGSPFMELTTCTTDTRPYFTSTSRKTFKTTSTFLISFSILFLQRLVKVISVYSVES